MNQTDRDMLSRVYSAIEVPGWHTSGFGGSATFDGAVSYAKDAGVVQGGMRDLLMALMVHPNHHDDHWPDPKAPEIIDALEWWHVQRAADGWTVAGARPFPTWQHVLSAFREAG